MTHEPARPTKKRVNRTARRDADTGDVESPRHSSRQTRKRSAGSDTPQRGDEVRRRTLQAALDCFATLGFAGTSTRAVAERAGVTHTLILYHFKSKDHLWISTMEYALSGYAAAQAEIINNAEGNAPEIVLRRFIENFVKLSAKYPEIHRIMTMEGSRETPRLRWVVDTYLREMFTNVRDVIRQAQSAGKVRECDAARLYYYIIGASSTMFTVSAEYRALTGRDVFSDAEIYRNIAFLFDTVFI